MREEEPVQVTGIDRVCGVGGVGGGKQVAADRLAIADEARSAGSTEARVVDVTFAAFAFSNSAGGAGKSTKERGVRGGCDWKQIACGWGSNKGSAFTGHRQEGNCGQHGQESPLSGIQKDGAGT